MGKVSIDRRGSTELFRNRRLTIAANRVASVNALGV